MADYTTNYSLPYQKNDTPRKLTLYNRAMDLLDAALKAVSNSAVASASIVADGDKGDVVLSATGTVWTIDANVVTNAKAAQMAANTIKGNNTGALANSIDLTAAQVTAMLTAHPTIQVFTVGGTWTKPAGCRRVWVRVVAGGGGGGAATAAAANACGGAGGGSGSYGEGVYDATAYTTQAITIGAAGAAGVSNGSGGAGGASSFGAVVTTNGGPGGVFQTAGIALAVTATGGSASAGTGGTMINAGGTTGGFVTRLSGTICISGNGAPGPFGGGASGKNTASGGQANGDGGGAPGAGGGGAMSSSASAFNGGAGAAGVVIIVEFY